MTALRIIIRPALHTDIPQLLPLIRGLAEYEHYLDVFAVTEETLRRQGFGKSPPDFYALVADTGSELVGLLVYYLIPFTMTARPTLFIKELFVAEAARGQHLGEVLIRRAAQDAVAHGCGTMRGAVADWNTSAQKFYTRLGAVPNPVWVAYGLSRDAVEKLASEAAPE